MFTEGYSYPHPVLGVEDDIAGEFNVTLQITRNSLQRKLVFCNIATNIINEYVKDLVGSGAAGILIKVYCASTFKTWTIVDPGESFELDENDLINKAEVQMYIVAKKEITDYQDGSFHSQFGETPFSVGTHEVLAVSGKVTLPIEKQHEKLGLGNIFKFFSHDADKPMTFTYQQDKIYIMYPVAVNGEHPPNWLFNMTPWSAYNLFIIPALAGAFAFIESEEKQEVENYEWYMVINNLLPEDQREDDAYVNAQLLLQKNIPITNAYEELKKKLP